MTMQTDREQKQAHDPVTPAGHEQEAIQERDADDASFLTGATLAGLMVAGLIGLGVGLVVALVPGIGLDWWGGVIIGVLVGIVIGAFVVGRLALRSVDDEAHGNTPKLRTGRVPRVR